MQEARTRSQWLDDVGREETNRPTFNGLGKLDVAVVGGGFVGLWSAIEIKRREPNCNVALFEMGRCGEGASGLNGGFVMSWWPKIGTLAALCGTDDAVWLADQTTLAIQDLPALLQAEGIDAEFRMGGWLWTATTERHRGAWDSVVEAAARLGRPEVFRSLSRDEIARRTGSPVHIAGVLEEINATVHPAKLSRGLMSIARRLGVKIFEHAKVLDVSRDRPARVTLDGATVMADKVIIATNAWAAGVPELRGKFVCVGSAVVATPPIPQRLRHIGWTGGESVTDSQNTINYYRTTVDGKIIFGKGGGRLYYTGEPKPFVFADGNGIEAAARDFRRTYPMLADVPLKHGWSGPIDRTYDSLPLLGRLVNAPHIAYAIGWSGNGVNPSRIGGKIMSSLVLDQRDRWALNALVGRRPRSFPPEPIRYVGGALVRAAMARKDAAEIAGRRASCVDRALASFGPAGLEDKG